MAKKVVALIKLALPAGKANPAPPVGPALGQRGVNIMAFCKEYNAKTSDKAGMIIPIAAGIEKGSSQPDKEKVGSITYNQLKDIAQTKMPDLNANDIDAAMNIVEGTARNMGVLIKD